MRGEVKFIFTVLGFSYYDDRPSAFAVRVMIGCCAVCVGGFGRACYGQCNAGRTSTQTLGDAAITA